MTDPTTEQLSDMVGTTIEHDGRQMRIVGYEMTPKRTPENRNCLPIFWLVEAGKERQPPYEFWEQVLCSKVPIPEPIVQDPEPWLHSVLKSKPNGNGRPYTDQEMADQIANAKRINADGHGL